MSLLLDALKRAEQEKLARKGDAAPAPTLRDAPPPHAPPQPRASAASASGLELQPMANASNATLGAAPRGDAHTAQTVFQAKAANADSGKSRGMIFATIGAVVVVAIAAGAYVWYSVSALAPRQAAVSSRPRPNAAPVPPPAGAPPAFSPAGEGPLASAALTAMGTDTTRTAQLSTATAPAASPAPAPAPVAPAPRLRPAEEAAASLLRDAAPAPTAEPLRLDRSPDAGRRVPADISNGYDQLRQGNLAGARRSYDAALAANPSNIDALLGVATVEARTGSRTSAAVFYRRALDIDPRNPTALAGLAALADSARPDAVEAQLRSDLARSPDSSALHFALGNVMSAQARWHEAQAEYFEAHRLDPGSPETMFNLAVSLDRLGQSRAAAGFYTRALDAVRGQQAPFDTAAVRRRLEELR